MEDTKKKTEINQDKVAVNWRILKKVVAALKADAKRQGFPSVPALLNHELTERYFGKGKS